MLLKKISKKTRQKGRHKTRHNAQMSNGFYDLKKCRMNYKIIMKNVE